VAEPLDLLVVAWWGLLGCGASNSLALLLPQVKLRFQKSLDQSNNLD